VSLSLYSCVEPKDSERSQGDSRTSFCQAALGKVNPKCACVTRDKREKSRLDIPEQCFPPPLPLHDYSPFFHSILGMIKRRTVAVNVVVDGTKNLPCGKAPCRFGNPNLTVYNMDRKTHVIVVVVVVVKHNTRPLFLLHHSSHHPHVR